MLSNLILFCVLDSRLNTQFSASSVYLRPVSHNHLFLSSPSNHHREEEVREIFCHSDIHRPNSVAEGSEFVIARQLLQAFALEYNWKNSPQHCGTDFSLL
jgi:hypothetical protein